jgi:drug/metabolite transporter (DMT)-like permease
VKFDVIILALIASGFTAMASVAQRQAAAPAPEKLTFSWRLVGYLIRRPVWFLGIASMILGFLFQVEALRRGSLVLVQPLIATELVIVFGVIAIHDRHRVHSRDWLSALGMVLGLGIFLGLARPGGGHNHASMSMWALSGLTTFALAGVLAGVAYLPGRQGTPPTPARKAALLGIAAATGFGFVAAVVKELSSHLSQGPGALFSNWSPYVLLLSGAAAMFLASNAFQAGSLAASQPGLTIVDPLVASVLGIVLFGERVNHDPLVLLGEVGALALLVTSVIVLSQSPLVQEPTDSPPDPATPKAVEASEPSTWTPQAHLPALTRRQPSFMRQRRTSVSSPLRVPHVPDQSIDRVTGVDEEANGLR